MDNFTTPPNLIVICQNVLYYLPIYKVRRLEENVSICEINNIL